MGGAWHTQKANDTIRELKKWLKNNPNADPTDREIAEQIILDLEEALGYR